MSPVVEYDDRSYEFRDDGKGTTDSIHDNPAMNRPGPHRGRVAALVLGLVTMVAAILGAYFFIDRNDYDLDKSSTRNANFQGSVSAVALEEHNVAEDCWLVLYGNVYDLTEYALEHPGGPEWITDFCGMDATTEYQIEHPEVLLKIIPETLLGAYEMFPTELPTEEPIGGARSRDGAETTAGRDIFGRR